MKQIIFFVLLVGMSVSTMQAQAMLKKSLGEWTSTYQLDAAQQSELETIIAREQRNLEEIEVIKTTQADLYRKHQVDIARMTRLSVKRLLKADQLPIFEAQEVLRLAEIKERQKELKRTGGTKEQYEALAKEKQ